MPCVPAPTRATLPTDAFNFSEAPDVLARSYENAETLMLAPWRAFWALAFESLDVRYWR